MLTDGPDLCYGGRISYVWVERYGYCQEKLWDEKDDHCSYRPKYLKQNPCQRQANGLAAKSDQAKDSSPCKRSGIMASL